MMTRDHSPYALRTDASRAYDALSALSALSARRTRSSYACAVDVLSLLGVATASYHDGCLGHGDVSSSAR